MCPACRRHTGRGLELFSLDVSEQALVQGDELLEGALRCRGCAQRYPVAAGIPVLLPDPAAALELLALPEDALALAALAQPGPDGAPVPHAVEQLSSYVDSSWGDLATPPAPWGFEALAGKLAQLEPVASTLDVGCGVGRSLEKKMYKLPGDPAGLSIGLDRSAFLLRAARSILSGKPFGYARRLAGRHYTAATVQAAPAPGVQLLCGDALNPPFVPGGFERVVALNVLDNVPSPRALLHHLRQLTAPGGELILSSPYAWRDGIVAEGERLGGADPAAALREELSRLELRIEDEAELPWSVQHNARAFTSYRVHYLRATRA